MKRVLRLMAGVSILLMSSTASAEDRRSIVSIGPTTVEDNTPRNRNQCAMEVVRMILNEGSFKDIRLTSVRGSKFYSLDGKFVFDAVDADGNRFEGFIRIDFDRILPKRDPRTGREITEERFECYLSDSGWGTSGARFKLRNQVGDTIQEIREFLDIL
jgi:hypothetical protein